MDLSIEYALLATVQQDGVYITDLFSYHSHLKNIKQNSLLFTIRPNTLVTQIYFSKLYLVIVCGNQLHLLLIRTILDLLSKNKLNIFESLFYTHSSIILQCQMNSKDNSIVLVDKQHVMTIFSIEKYNLIVKEKVNQVSAFTLLPNSGSILYSKSNTHELVIHKQGPLFDQQKVVHQKIYQYMEDGNFSTLLGIVFLQAFDENRVFFSCKVMEQDGVNEFFYLLFVVDINELSCVQSKHLDILFSEDFSIPNYNLWIQKLQMNSEEYYLLSSNQSASLEILDTELNIIKVDERYTVYVPFDTKIDKRRFCVGMRFDPFHSTPVSNIKNSTDLPHPYCPLLYVYCDDGNLYIYYWIDFRIQQENQAQKMKSVAMNNREQVLKEQNKPLFSFSSTSVFFTSPNTTFTLLQPTSTALKEKTNDNQVRVLDNDNRALQQQVQELQQENNLLKQKCGQIEIEKNELLLQAREKAEELEQRLQDAIYENSKLKVTLLKQCENTVAMNEVTIPQLQQYESLLDKLFALQTGLFSEQDLNKQQHMILERNNTRRSLLACIDTIVSSVKDQMEPLVNKLVVRLSSKKLEHFFQMKTELNNDIAMEDKMSEFKQEKAMQLEQELELLKVELSAFKRRNNLEQAAQVEQEMNNLSLRLQQQKQMNSDTRINPLFGFPEYQHFMLDQERIENLSTFYEIEKTDTSFVIATRKDNNMRVFIRKFGKLVDWNVFKTQVEEIKKLNHLCVITINRVMYDDHLYYVEMPLINNGNLYNWLFKSEQPVTLDSKNERSGFEVQQLLRLVAQTIDYLHENGVIHTNLRMENIMMQNETIPILIGLLKATKSTLVYTDPAVQWGSAKLNTTSDVYNFGIIMLKCFSKYPLRADAIAIPNKDIPEFVMSDFIIEDENLVQLLKGCLHREQEKRLTAQEIIFSPFFFKFLRNDRGKNDMSRIEVFREYIITKRSRINSTLNIRLSESSIVEQLSDLIVNSDSALLYKRLLVHFDDSNTISTASMFKKYFEHAVKHRLLVKGTSCFHICDDQSLKMNEHKKKVLMIGLGVMLCLCLYELRSSGGIELSSVLIKYLIAKSDSAIKINTEDYESFDLTKSSHLSNLLVHSNLSELHMDFRGLTQNGECMILTNDNLNDYIQLTIRNEMISKRKQNLDWVKEGFYKMQELKEHLHKLQVNDFHILFGSDQMIDISSIVTNCLFFLNVDFASTQQELFLNLQNWLQEVLLEMSQEEFKLFLLFCTGHTRTASKDMIFCNNNSHSGYALNKINIRVVTNTNQLPQAYVCFYLLDLPLFKDKQLLEQKLKLAVLNSNDSIIVA